MLAPHHGFCLAAFARPWLPPTDDHILRFESAHELFAGPDGAVRGAQKVRLVVPVHKLGLDAEATRRLKVRRVGTRRSSARVDRKS